MPTTLINIKLAEKYLELVKEKYTEPKNEEILGCFVTNIAAGVIQKAVGKESRKSKVLPKKQPKQIDIRKMFSLQPTF